MFNKSALLIIIGAAFAVALPTGSIPKGPSTLDGVHALGANIPGVSDVKTPSTNYVGVAGVHKEIREVAPPSFQLPQADAEKEKAPTVPKVTFSVPAVSLPQRETDELPEVDAPTASVLKNLAAELPKIPRSAIPALPRKGKNKSKGKSGEDDSETPDASTLKPPSGSAAITWYARTQPNDTAPQPNDTAPQPNITTPEGPDVSRRQSAVRGAGKVTMSEGNLPRERHIPGVYMPSVPSTPELTQSSPPKDLYSLATHAATGLESASSFNVKSPSLARRAESCDSDYTLTYCREVLQSGNSFIPTLLQSFDWAYPALLQRRPTTLAIFDFTNSFQTRTIVPPRCDLKGSGCRSLLPQVPDCRAAQLECTLFGRITVREVIASICSALIALVLPAVEFSPANHTNVKKRKNKIQAWLIHEQQQSNMSRDDHDSEQGAEKQTASV
ncbi:hypothetical protein EDB19DRAFT_1827646 [Suillus lakei]|nr:hypothetical protein EDB19DRAFT_1827646 [Suillus lakei]